MNERDDREARLGGGVSDRGAATISVPAQDFAGKAHATQSLEARGERHLTGRHLENVRATGSVENVRSFEEARKRLAVLAVADEAKAGGRRNRAGDAAHTTATASQQDIYHLAFSISMLLGRSPKKYGPLDMKLRIARQSAMANAMMSSSLWRRVP